MAKKSPVKIVKTFNSDIKSCKDYSYSFREVCIICKDEKFGLAERLKDGRLSILIECKYDYIDSFCCHSANAVAVMQSGKWGLYSFRYTVGRKDINIDCRQITECEYSSVSMLSDDIILLVNGDRTLRRYYNIFSNHLSEFYEHIPICGSHYIECETETTVKWIDTYGDFVIYSADSLSVFPTEISEDVFLFTKYSSPDENNQNKSDLVFFNRNLQVSYVIEDIDCMNIIRNGFERLEEHIVLIFRKDGKKHIIAVEGITWDIEEVQAIAKEIEYT